MKAYIYITTVLLVLSFSSCEKFVELDPPINKIISSTVFIDDKTASAAVLGLYSRMALTGGTFSNGTTTVYLGLASDELTYTGNVSDFQAFNSNMVSADNSILYSNFWSDPYKIIYQANACIEGLKASSSINPSLKQQLEGEAIFVRAFCYWHLINFFGDVPLVLTTDYETNALEARTSKSHVISQIIKDLKQARTFLSKSYPSTGKLRPNFYTATALLNRVYLYNEDWQNTEETATEIINSGMYSLETDLSKCFIISSREAVWQLAIPDAQIVNTIEGNRFIPITTATAIPAYAITPSLLSGFETCDLRRANWINSKSVSGVTYNYPYKYKVRSGTAKSEHCIIFRLAELYLNRAEARAHLNNLTGALGDLNTIRLRANLGAIPINVIDNQVVMSVIQRERRLELFAEWGFRWFDLKRTGLIDNILGTAKSTWKSTAALYPIPSDEIAVNSNLIQNPGY